MEKYKRILIVDDNKSIHDDIKAILDGSQSKQQTTILALEDELFDDNEDTNVKNEPINYLIDDAYQGEEALQIVDRAAQESYPYSLIFMDVRMPPGIDGIETIQKIWQKHPYIEVVICTAYSDYSWDAIIFKFGKTDKLMFLKKPFDATAIKQMTLSVTTKWELQQKSIHNIENLEKEVSKRTEQLTETLREQKELQKRAELATIAKGEFLANMSHEIRTPLNGVVGMAELLEQTELTEEQRECVETILSSSDTLLTVINDILDFSKIDAGKLEINCIPFDLRVSIEDIVQLLSKKAESKNLKLITGYPSDTPFRIIGDPSRIRQILTNLIGNAIKFTKEGHVFINVEKFEQNEKEVTLKISVEDTGIGIPKDKLKDIFEKFSQADASTTRNYGGTGLGLAITKQLVELMGGKIGIQSQLNKGSTFFIVLTLPLDEQQTAQLLPAADLTGVRTIIVDDNKTNLMVMLEQTTSLGMVASAFGSTQDALDAMRRAYRDKKPIQIAILDHKMPEMDGEALGQIIKKDNELQKTILIMLSSMGQKGLAKRAKQIGFEAYLTKPVRQSQFHGILAATWAAKFQKGSNDLITKYKLAESRTEPSELGKTTKQENRGCVLLVEDNMINQRVAMKMLAKLGYVVEVVNDGKEAVEKHQIQQFDMIFMDCQMPRMDGYEATTEIRKLETGGQRIPIIAMTANAMKSDREKCIEAGMDDYISKPVSLPKLQKVLECWSKDSELVEHKYLASITQNREDSKRS